MADLKTVGIKDLKNNLSAYLREVRRGTRILVSDRSSVVAEIREPSAAYHSEEPTDPLVAEWIREGSVKPPRHKKSPLPASPVSLEEGAALKLLDLVRGDATA